MARQASSDANAAVQAVIVKKCDRTYHRPGSNKGCAAGTCQHTCEPGQTGGCAHKWTVRYSVSSRQREQSFAALEDAQTFQLELTAGKRTQGTLYTDPKAGAVPFLPLCGKFINDMAKASAASKNTYRSIWANPAVTALFTGKSVLEAATMDDQVTRLLNTTLIRYGNEYRATIRRVITGTLDQCVRKGIIPRHTLTGIELAPRAVTAEQYEQESRGLVTVTDDVVRILADGLTAGRPDKRGRVRRHVLAGLGIAVWLQRTMGLRIREALGVRKSDFRERADGSRYLHLCWQASGDGRTLEPLKHRKPGQFRDIPVPGMVWNMAQAMPDGPLCPGRSTPYLPYNTAFKRLNRILAHLGISGVHTHSLRHQFATETLEADPRELASVSQVLGHDSVETTLRYYIHPSANAEQRIGALMNQRWAIIKPGTPRHGQPEPAPRHRPAAAPAAA